MSAQEKIWVDDCSKCNGSLASGTKPAFTNATEYTRHDISQALVAAAYEDVQRWHAFQASSAKAALDGHITETLAARLQASVDIHKSSASRHRNLTPANAQAHLDRMIAEAEARGAEAEREAIATMVYNSDPEAPPPPEPFDEWGDMTADTSERHAERVSDYENWTLANTIRSRGKSDD